MGKVTRKILTIENPRLAREWCYEKNEGQRPENFTGASNKSVWWKCKLGHTWQTMITNRSRGQNCPYCTGRKAWIGFNDLATVWPEVATQWDCTKNEGRRPEQFTSGSKRKVWWRCKLGHSWKAVIYSRKNHDCPHCYGNTLTPGVNDLLTANPRLASEWDTEKNDGLRPENVAAYTAAKVWWRCAKNHSWLAQVRHRSNGTDCPYCNNKLALKGFNDLLTNDPVLSKEWDYEKNKLLRPDEVTENSGKYAWWKCKRGHSWRTTVAGRRRGAKCPYCAGKLVIPGETDLKTLRPDLAEEWDNEENAPLTPEQVTAQSTKKVWWRCKNKGHLYQAVVYNRYWGTDCPYCAGHIPIVGETDLATVYPKLADEWDYEENNGKKPEEYTCGSNKKIHWKCRCGYRWRATICSRTAGSNCPRCNGKTHRKSRFV